MRTVRFVAVVSLCFAPLLAAADGGATKPSGPMGIGKHKKHVAARDGKSARPKPAAEKNLPAITAEQETAATESVKQHHDELLELLIYLKEGLPKEYARAVRDLSRTSERLSALAKRDKPRYELELKLWQVQSHRQLLQARLQMTKDDKLIDQIRDTLHTERELKTALMRHERERLAARLKKVDAQLARQAESDDAAIERQLKVLLKSGKKTERKPKAPSRKPVAAKSKNKPA